MVGASFPGCVQLEIIINRRRGGLKSPGFSNKNALGPRWVVVGGADRAIR